MTDIDCSTEECIIEELKKIISSLGGLFPDEDYFLFGSQYDLLIKIKETGGLNRYRLLLGYMGKYKSHKPRRYSHAYLH